MAVETEPPATDSVSATPTLVPTASEPPKKFPKGVVLGKDGKPYVSVQEPVYPS